MTTKTRKSARPRIQLDEESGAPIIALTPSAYIDLLIQANNTDPRFWPPQAKEGARALARLRAIERKCAEAHGAFDWERLSDRAQDEYDSLSAKLDGLRSESRWNPSSTPRASTRE
jgi:hypothetical protein